MENQENQIELEMRACEQLGWPSNAMTLDGDHVICNLPGISDSDREAFERLVRGN